MGGHESLLASPLVLPSHHSEAHPLDCHRSSLLFCFPTPLVSPFSPFSFPSSVPFTAAFIAAPIAQSSRALICAPALFNRLAEELRLTSSTCLSHPFSTSLSTCCSFIFPSDCCFLPGIFFYLPLPVIGIFFPGSRRLSQHALTFALSVGLALPFHSRKRGPPRTN